MMDARKQARRYHKLLKKKLHERADAQPQNTAISGTITTVSAFRKDEKKYAATNEGRKGV